MRLSLLLAVSLAALLACSSRSTNLSARVVLAHPSDGFVRVEGGRVRYEVQGWGLRTPLLVLHGGPGIPHDYLENLAELGDERPVVFYDQLGCGASDRPSDPALWTRERFCREIDVVRADLGLHEVVLYGHSWGALLAVDYLSGRGGSEPEGVLGLILAGPALSLPRWSADARRLIETLPAETRDAIHEAERTGETDSEAFHAAMDVFYRRYVCRADPWPEGLERAFAGMSPEVYGTMNGPSEFTITGTLKDVDVSPALAGLRMPVLFVCGEFDEATPETTRAYAAHLPGSEVAVIEGASHVANFDRPETYMATLRSWMDRHGL